MSIDFSPVYQHDDFLIVVKPAGISVHCDDHQKGFAALLIEHFHKPLYVVHRLDKVTSGLMIFAKSAEAAAYFGGLFERKEIEKHYLAISDQKPKKKQGAIKGDMQKSRRSSWRLLKTQNQPAISQFVSYSLMPGFRVFLVKPKTGKTHQIRVALKSIGAAILGDPIYSSSQLGKSVAKGGLAIDKEVELVVDRCYLHAWQLAFNYQGECFNFQQLPVQGDFFLMPEFLEAVQRWEKPANFFNSH